MNHNSAFRQSAVQWFCIESDICLQQNLFLLAELERLHGAVIAPITLGQCEDSVRRCQHDTLLRQALVAFAKSGQIAMTAPFVPVSGI